MPEKIFWSSKAILDFRKSDLAHNGPSIVRLFLLSQALWSESGLSFTSTKSTKKVLLLDTEGGGHIRGERFYISAISTK